MDKASRFDRMVKEKKNDELGLFEKYEETLAKIRKRIIKYRAKTVVDMGCGTGNLCGELSKEIEVLGIDKSLEMLEGAKRKYKHIKFKIGSFLDKPFIEKWAEVVVNTYAFHGLNSEEKKEAIKNMIGYLKDDGRIIIGDYMFKNKVEKEECRNKLLSKKRQDLWEVIDGRYYTDLEELEDYVKSLGFKIISEHMVNFTWIVEIY
ncbi:SAM-dependent methyltransferase, partial [Clostridium acetobutylicum]